MTVYDVGMVDTILKNRSFEGVRSGEKTVVFSMQSHNENTTMHVGKTGEDRVFLRWRCHYLKQPKLSSGEYPYQVVWVRFGLGEDAFKEALRRCTWTSTKVSFKMNMWHTVGFCDHGFYTDFPKEDRFH